MYTKLLTNRIWWLFLNWGLSTSSPQISTSTLCHCQLCVCTLPKSFSFLDKNPCFHLCPPYKEGIGAIRLKFCVFFCVWKKVNLFKTAVVWGQISIEMQWNVVPNISKMFQRPNILRYLSHIRKEIVVGSLWKFLRGLIREKQLHGFPKDCPQQICAAVLLPGQMKH